MLFSQHLIEQAKLIEGLSEKEREMLIDEATISDHPKRDVMELMLDNRIRDIVLNDR